MLNRNYREESQSTSQAFSRVGLSEPRTPTIRGSIHPSFVPQTENVG
jgi:hypothetical protein